ncbi:MAG: DUF2202 domain-containing protein [Ilumatobacteraceae bacterium]
MTRRTTAIIIGAAATAMLSLGAVAYAASGGNGPWRHLKGGGMHSQGMGSGSAADMSGRMGDMNGTGMHGQGWIVPAATGGSVDSTERDGLLRMVEEEKLAHDVYVTLGDKWDVQMFDHIASAETQHEAAVQTLLGRYGIADPTAGEGVGEFTNPAFDSLYAQLVADGNVSQDAAFQVGQQVEQLDIDDLESRMATTDNADITAVYQHLLAGSQHHLQAFTMMLEG